MRTALNRQVVGSIPTASTIESSTYKLFFFRLRRTSPNCFRTLRTAKIPSFQAQRSNWRRPAFEHCICARIDRLENALVDRLYVHVPGRLDTRVPQHTLGVL